MYLTGSAASDYDVAPYDANPIELSSLETIAAASRVWGFSGEIKDVLDLGCGFGRQLAQVATGASGRLVGVDASMRTCEGARKVLEPWSGRAEILQANFDDLHPGQLGAFDLIYCVGTLYTLPSSVRDTLLRIMAACLRPGGRILMTYYAGTNGDIHAAVSNYIRSLQPGGQSLPDALATARQHLAAALSFQTPSPIEAVRNQIVGIAGYDDTVMTHEILGHGVHVQNTATIASALEPISIRFLGYLGYEPVNFDCNFEQRLYRAITLDLLEGGYRYAVFGRELG